MKNLEKFITSNKTTDLRLFFRLSLFLLLGLAGLFLWHPSAPVQGTGIRLADSTQNVAPASTPVPYFQLTWTAEARSNLDISEGNTRTVMSRRVVMDGSTVVRKLSNQPNGLQDNFPFDLTVTDDFDRLKTSAGYCAGGGIRQEHQYWSIRDPRRYNAGFTQPLTVSDPFKLGEDWYITDPFQDIEFSLLDNPFFYDSYIDTIDCSSGNSSLNGSGDNLRYAISLQFPSDGILIKGDEDGNVFEVAREFPHPSEPTETVNWTFVARRLLERDLTVKRLEVTQGLQDGANSIPLVQGRRTVVRAYIGLGREQMPMDNVTGQLTVFSGGNELGTVNPFNPGGRITARVSPNWLEINDTLNFEVPLPWTRMPSLRFEVKVNPDPTLFETNYTNNMLSASLNLKDCNAGINIGYVPIHFTPPEGNFGWPDYPDPKIHGAQEFMRKIFPVPERGLKYSLLPEMKWRISLNYEVGGDLLLDALGSRRMNSSPRPDHIFGWLPRGGYTAFLGLSTLPGATAWGQDGLSWWLVLPHEIAHNKGLVHTDGGTGGSHWFDVYERKIKPPSDNQQLYGLMRPSAYREIDTWISPTSYRELISKMCSGGGAQMPEDSPQTPTAGDNLIVTGTVSNLTVAAGTLNPLYRTATTQVEIPDAGTSYCVKLKDAAGTMLSQYCFSVSFEGEGGIPATAAPFGMAVPYPVGLNRVELTKDTTVLSTRLASANPPSVTLTFPNASGLTLSGVQNVTWNGSDPDGGTLTYTLLHSRDNGATWNGIGSGIVGNSEAVNFSALPGGTGGLIKVMVSDGFRSAEDVADNPFSVANKPPIAAIVSPPTDTSFPVNTKLTLQATGADLEDGFLSDAAFNWSSDRDGALGTGQILEVSLSPGTHTITLTARDVSGLTNTATITCNAASITTTSTPTPTPTPTPTFVAVSGRAFTPSGLGLKNAIVAITDSLGVRQTATTSSFGSYRFEAVQTGGTYVISVASKRYRFASRIVPVTGTLSDFDFFGLE